MTPEEVSDLEKAEAFIMKHGVHRGNRLGSLPSAYLYWMALEWSDPEVAKFADLIWHYRDKHLCHRGIAKYPRHNNL